MTRTVLSETIGEEESFTYGVNLVAPSDANPDVDEPITPDQLQSATLTLYHATTGTIINDVEYEDLLTSPRADIDAVTGRLTIEFTHEDNVIVDETSKVLVPGQQLMAGEWHIALIRLAWTGGPTGTRKASHEIKFAVVNLQHVPED